MVLECNTNFPYFHRKTNFENQRLPKKETKKTHTNINIFRETLRPDSKKMFPFGFPCEKFVFLPKTMFLSLGKNFPSQNQFFR